MEKNLIFFEKIILKFIFSVSKLSLVKEIYNFGEARKLEQLLNLMNTFKL